jgi:ubiquinone biosynthesis accessory factor UbiK
MIRGPRLAHQSGATASTPAPIWTADYENGAWRSDSALAFSPRLRYQIGMAFESIDELARRLAESVPQGLRSVKDELEKNFRSVLRSGLGKLDLVTREEFEVQEAVLARTRQKLDALEQQLNAIETASAVAAGTGSSKKKKKKKKKKMAKTGDN